jgi:hypothetical protein
MAWAGISMVRVRPGQTPEQAVTASIAEWFEVTEDGIETVPNPDAEEVVPSAETDQWMEWVTALLRRANPTLEVVDEHFEESPAHHRKWTTLDDRLGPVWFAVYPGEVAVRAGRGYADPEGHDGEGFAAMWGYCQLLAREAGCVAYAPDEDEMIDLSLDVGTARERYLGM